METMKLPSLVIRVKGDNGGYCANMITVVTHEGVPSIMFLCSGSPMILPADQITSIEYAANYNTWCPHCDTQWNQVLKEKE